MRERYGKDYYQILGLSENAAESEIRKAYRKLALEWHPDRNQGRSEATEKFKEISEAYAVLIDSSKRLQYDQARQSAGNGEFRYSQEDIFRDFFRNPGATAIFEELAREFERMGMRVDRQYLHQTLFGGRATVTGGVFIVTPFSGIPTLFRLVRAALQGAGLIEPRTKKSIAGRTGILSGIARFGKWLIGGGSEKSLAGSDVLQPLHLTLSEASKGGSKQVRLTTGPGAENVLLKIPAGIKPGSQLRLRGKGRNNPDGTRGDLYLQVIISE